MTFMIPIHSHSNNVLHILYSCSYLNDTLFTCLLARHCLTPSKPHTHAHDYYYCCFSYLVTVVHSSFADVVAVVVYSLAHVPP